MPVKNDREIQCERDVVRRLTAGAGAGADAPVESSAFARALNGTAEEGTALYVLDLFPAF